MYRAAKELFTSDSPENERDIHLGVDLFLPAGSPIKSPLLGKVSDVVEDLDLTCSLAGSLCPALVWSDSI